MIDWLLETSDGHVLSSCVAQVRFAAAAAAADREVELACVDPGKACVLSQTCEGGLP